MTEISRRASSELTTPQEVKTPPPATIKETSTKSADNKSVVADELSLIEDSMTPPLSIRATSIPGEELNEDAAMENATKSGSTAAPKKNEWDMFAEQDLDSNFDVSCNNFRVLLFWRTNQNQFGDSLQIQL